VPLSGPPEASIKQGKAFSGSLIAILMEGFLSRLSFGIISFALPLYAYRSLGLSLTETGLLFSLNLVAEQIFKPLMGWAADRAGLKRSLTCAIALRSVVAFLLVFAGSPLQIYAIRFLHGISESLRDPSVNALIAEHSDRRSLGASFAWYSTAKMAAGSIGKAIGGALLVWTGEDYSRTFFIAFALSGLPLYAVARFVREPERHLTTEGYNDAHPASTTVRIPEGLVSAATLGFFMATTAQMVQQLFPILATEYGGLSVAQTSLIYALSIALLLGSGPLFGWMSDRVSRNAVLMLRGVCNAASSLLFWFAPGFSGFAAGSIADALGKSAFRPAWGALMAQMSGSDRRRRAQLMSYMSLGEGLGETLGPLLGGLLWHFGGIPVLMGVRLALAACGEAYAIRTMKFWKGPDTNAHMFSDGTAAKSEFGDLSDNRRT
jgi:MFS family permease